MKVDNEQVPLFLMDKKKKLKSYTVKEKLIAINVLNNKGRSCLLTELGIEPNLVYKWRMKMNELQESNGKKRRLSVGAKTKLSKGMESDLYKKLMDLRSAMIPISGRMVQIFALQIANANNIDKFKATDGWLERFRTRHDLSLRKGTKRCPKIGENICNQNITICFYMGIMMLY